jgi:hypothetical protein
MVPAYQYGFWYIFMGITHHSQINFKSYHITWVAWAGEDIPAGLQYSHRCHQPTCIEPSHGTWETDEENKDRNRCKGSSHIILSHQAIAITLCDHSPEPCLSAAPEIVSGDDPRIVPLLVPNRQPPVAEDMESDPWVKGGEEMDSWLLESTLFDA